MNNILSLKRLVLIVIGLILAAAFYVAWNYSFIEVSASGDFTYQISRVDGGSDPATGQASGTRRTLVKRGLYEVLVKQDSKTHFKAMRADGWLSTNSVAATPQPEHARQIVADNPAPCVNDVDGQFISYPCIGPYSSLQVHQPATKNSPGYIKTPDSAAGGIVEDIFKVGARTFALIHNRGEAVPVPHQIFQLDKDGELSRGRVISGLDPNSTYKLLPHKDGFIAHSSDLKSIYFMGSDFVVRNEITPPNPRDNSLELYALSAGQEVLAFAYSVGEDDEDIDLDDPSVVVDSELILVDDNGTRITSLDNRYSQLSLCGENFLCGLVSNRLDVLKLSGDKAQQLYSISNTKYVEQLNDRILVARQNETLLLDLASGEGYVHYDYGSADFCGLQVAESYYDLCLSASDGARLALRIDPDKAVGFRVDDVRDQLIDQEFIKSVSINFNVIYISADLGERTYVESIGGFGYDPNTKQNVANQINMLVKSLHIPSSYTVVNTAAN